MEAVELKGPKPEIRRNPDRVPVDARQCVETFVWTSLSRSTSLTID